MASTYSPNLRLELIGTGEQQGTWGGTTNINLGTLLEQAICGYESVTVSNVADTTLSANNGSADQSRNMTLNLIGTISATRNVICPAIEKIYIVKNATTGGFAVTFKVTGQTGVSIPNGATVIVYVDGTDVRLVSQFPVPVTLGGTGVTTSTGSGSVVLSTSPALTTPNLGTPSAATLTNATGLPIDAGTTGTLPVARGGTGVTASTGSGSVVLSTSPTLTTPNLGTPSAATLTNATGLPIVAGTTGTLSVARGGTGVTTSTGSGNLVLSTSPSLTTPSISSPAMSGTPTAPTAAANTNTTQVATTAFVLGQGNSTAGTIAMNGTQAAGSSALYARADHVHPSDTSRAPLASPTFTGTPAAPTASVDTNTTQIATTAYVVGQGYLKSATAASTYLTSATAASTYLTISNAASTYLATATAASTYAPLASPALSGTPTAPTAAGGTNTTQIATTAFVQTAISGISTSSFTLLGTITTTSGSSQSLSGLSLSSYKQVYLVFNAISNTNGTSFDINSAAPAVDSFTSGGSLNGYAVCDLSSGVGRMTGRTSGGVLQDNARYFGITTATTTITISVSPGTMDAGSVTVYGIK